VTWRPRLRQRGPMSDRERREYAQKVRAWAREQNMLIGKLGPLPIAMIEAYEEAHAEQDESG
jgi:hypothetical protein